MLSTEYLNHPGISRGALKVANDSWTKYAMVYESRLVHEEVEQTDALLKGICTHAALFQPELLTRVIVPPRSVLSEQGHRRGKAWKNFVADATANNKIVVSQDVGMAIAMMTASVNLAIGELLTIAQDRHFELPIYWKDGNSGLSCKAQPDFVFASDGYRIVMDLKCTNDLSLAGFRRSSRSHGYWLQDAHYRDAVESHFDQPVMDFLFVCVESVPPYRTRVRRFTPEMVEAADSRRRMLLSEIARRRRDNDWSEPGENDIEETEHSLP